MSFGGSQLAVLSSRLGHCVDAYDQPPQPCVASWPWDRDTLERTFTCSAATGFWQRGVAEVLRRSGLLVSREQAMHFDAGLLYMHVCRCRDVAGWRALDHAV